MKYLLLCLLILCQFGCRSEKSADPAPSQPGPPVPAEPEPVVLPEIPEQQPVEVPELSESETVTALEQFGGQITRDASGAVYGVSVAYGDFSDAQLSLVKNLRSLRDLDLAETQVTDEGLGWYHFHHHHFHISLEEPEPLAWWLFPRFAPRCLSRSCDPSTLGRQATLEKGIIRLRRVR